MENIKKVLIGLLAVIFVAMVSEARPISRQTQNQQKRIKRGVQSKASKNHKTKKQSENRKQSGKNQRLKLKNNKESGESKNEIKVVPVPGVDSDVN